MNGPINLLVKAALEVAEDDHQRHPIPRPTSADQHHPASRAAYHSHPHPNPHSAQGHPHHPHNGHHYATSHGHDYGHYSDLPRQAAGDAERNRMVSGDWVLVRP